MRAITKKGKSVKLKCETDTDWRELTQSIPIQSIASLPHYKLKLFLIELKNGMITVSIKKAIEKNWILDDKIANRI